MKFVRQFCLILGLTFLGELCRFFIPLPVPAGIYGLLLFLLCLLTGLIRAEQVEETADFLVEIMPLLFIPAGVGLMDSMDLLRPMLLPLLVITPLTTLVVMVVTGHTTQMILKKKEKKEVKEGKDYESNH